MQVVGEDRDEEPDGQRGQNEGDDPEELERLVVDVETQDGAQDLEAVRNR